MDEKRQKLDLGHTASILGAEEPDSDMVRSSCTTLTRFVIGLLNIILGVAFLALAIVGILLRTNKDFLLKFTSSLSERFLSGASKEQADEVAQFLLKYDVEIPVIFIVVGLVITAVCILGFIASCCSCNKLLKIYAAILTVMVLVQIIAVAIIFGIPNIYRNLALQSLEKTLAYYNPSSPEGKGPTGLWNLIMSSNDNTCCGMDGAGDFKNTPYSPNCPKFCCGNGQDCTIAKALELAPPVSGCRDKIGRYADEYMLKVLIILAIFITLQVILTILTHSTGSTTHQPMTCGLFTPMSRLHLQQGADSTRVNEPLTKSEKLGLQLFNATLCVLFVIAGTSGIILLSCNSIVQSIVNMVFDVANVKPEDLHEIAQFTIKNIGGIASILIVIGFVIAALCFLGCISPCCGFDLLLKIYTAILVALLLGQMIAVTAVFSNPNLLSHIFTNVTKELLPFYGNATRPEMRAAMAIWNAIMELGSKLCCEMDGYGDFRTLNLPVQCCAKNASTCIVESAKEASIPGCRNKIVDFARINQESIMYICIVAILLQVTLIVIASLAICL
ncbi:Tetraspanin-6 [Taenia crassiceps]|uniref:Tetraspanin-6 n=1 Tax=Taenia crassiceps TaxID=6207 RepID=A0ABR4Q383_9CEST